MTEDGDEQGVMSDEDFAQLMAGLHEVLASMKEMAARERLIAAARNIHDESVAIMRADGMPTIAARRSRLSPGRRR